MPNQTPNSPRSILKEVINMHVYFIKCCDRKGYIKIGVANNVEDRCSTLQTGCPYKLEIIAVMKFSDKKKAYNAERTLHRLFKKNRIYGEWFSKVDMKWAQEFLNKQATKESKTPILEEEWAEMDTLSSCPFL